MVVISNAVIEISLAFSGRVYSYGSNSVQDVELLLPGAFPLLLYWWFAVPIEYHGFSH